MEIVFTSPLVSEFCFFLYEKYPAISNSYPMFVFLERIFFIIFLWNRSLTTPFDHHPGVSDKHPQFPIEFLPSGVQWNDEYALISQYFPDRTIQEKNRNPLRWYAFDQQKLIGLIYAYGKGLPNSKQIRYRQRSPFIKNRSLKYRSRSTSLNSMQQSVRQRATRIRMINPRFIHLSLIIVDRAYQHKNIGSRLLERIEIYCQDFDCQYIELVPTPDRRVKEFYQRRGYVNDYRRGFLVKYFQQVTRPRSDRYPYKPV